MYSTSCAISRHDDDKISKVDGMARRIKYQIS